MFFMLKIEDLQADALSACRSAIFSMKPSVKLLVFEIGNIQYIVLVSVIVALFSFSFHLVFVSEKR